MLDVSVGSGQRAVERGRQAATGAVPRAEMAASGSLRSRRPPPGGRQSPYCPATRDSSGGAAALLLPAFSQVDGLASMPSRFPRVRDRSSRPASPPASTRWTASPVSRDSSCCGRRRGRPATSWSRPGPPRRTSSAGGTSAPVPRTAARGASRSPQGRASSSSRSSTSRVTAVPPRVGAPTRSARQTRSTRVRRRPDLSRRR